MTHRCSVFVSVRNQLVLSDDTLVESAFNSFLLHISIFVVGIQGRLLFMTTWLVSKGHIHFVIKS